MTTGRTIQSRRNGVILLLVLAMLAMFAMLIATFMVVTSQQFRQAESVGKLDRYVQSPKDDLDSVLSQMLVGGNSKSSVIRYLSLGATMYGDPDRDGLTGTVNAIWGETSRLVPLISPMQYERFGIELVFNDTGSLPNNLAEWLSMKGNVITLFDTVRRKWVSARILGFDPASVPNGQMSGSITVYTTAIPGTQIPTGAGSYQAELDNSIQRHFDFTKSPHPVDFYINPPAFAGKGVGYVPPDIDDTTPVFWADYANARLLDGDGDMPYAMQLNPNSTSNFGTLLDGLAWQLNVDYTAPNETSPFLGWFDMRFNGGVYQPNDSTIIPSYHRPSLIASGMDENALRKVVMRPMPFDHPEFDGSNPTLATLDLAQLKTRLANLQGDFLDVDTDGDGVKDAVWVDVGLPVRTDIHGRTYKPLVAIKCIDLDGRLNLNAHGNLAEQWDDDVMSGSGFGPAGINLTRGIASFTSPLSLSPQNIIDLKNELFLNRYTGQGESIPRNPNQSTWTGSLHAQLAWLSLPGANPLFNFFGNLPDYWDQGMLMYVDNGGNRNSAFDPLGNRFNNFPDSGPDPYCLRLDLANGVWSVPSGLNTPPYMFDPNRRTPYDQPFTLPELEAVLRQNDIDKDVLPGRLREIIGFGRNATTGRPNESEVLKVAAYNITTMSNDVPVPGPALADQGYASLYELIYRCVEKEEIRLGVSLGIPKITMQLIEYLPDEIKQGGKINLNKLVEDPTMFLFDLDPTTPAYENALYERMKMARGIYIILMALSYDKLYGVLNPAYDPMDPTSNRYIVEPYIEPSFLQAKKIADLKTSNINEFYRVCRELATTRLAQWAVNVVDFTDVDAIMTPFIFDVNPFDGNGWGSRDPGDSYTLYGVLPNEFDEYQKDTTHQYYRLVWGMERPDLLLTEALAMHNRNVADTTLGGKAFPKIYEDYIEFDVNDGEWKLKPSGPGLDENIRTLIQNTYMQSGRISTDFDQIRMPQGPAFLELYCAADPNRPYFPQELYEGNHLALWRMSPDGFHPVWQVAISKSNYKKEGNRDDVKTKVLMENSIVHRMRDHSATFSYQPSSPYILTAGDIPKDIEQPEFEIDRYVWFASQPPPTDFHGSEPYRVYYNHSGNVGLQPNEYLVVGPRLVTHLTSLIFSGTNSYGKPAGSKIDLSYDPNFKATNLVSASGIGQPKVMIAAAQVDPADSATWVTESNSTPWVTVAGQAEETFRKTLWLGNGVTNPIGLGFSISEPFRSAYYKKPTASNPHLDKNASGEDIVDAYGTLSSIATGNDRMEEQVDGSTMPLSADGLVGNGIAPFYKSAFLQRLADPLRPWHEVNNPYITVDWNMFDLKVYSGESTDGNNIADEKELYIKPPLEESGTTKHFSSRQWGVVTGSKLTELKRALPNPWDRYLDTSDLPAVSGMSLSSSSDIEKCGVAQAIELTGLVSPIKLPYQPDLTISGTLAFDQFPVHSLGRLGTDPKLMHPVTPLTTPTLLPMSQVQAGGIATNFPHLAYVNTTPQYLGSPVLATPDANPPETWGITAVPGFQHLPWHNGPMANSYEVMQVPASSPGRFGVEFVDRIKEIESAATPPPYKTNYLLEDVVLAAIDPAGDHIEDLPGSLGSNVRFGHLLNFQHSHGSWWVDWFVAPHVNAAGTPTAPPFVSLDLANFLNFVNVPSRFVGTRDWYQDANGNYYSYSRFREPGKINLNTLTASGFAALMENRSFHQQGDAIYDDFNESRGNIIGGDHLFVKPYRGASASLLNVDAIYDSPVNATLLRGSAADPLTPAFAPDDPAAPSTENTYTALEGIQRLSDMTTTRSNVFAVWLTLGYFEVEKIQPSHLPLPNGISVMTDSRINAIYPDGYMLKKEVGLETGEIKRHRAFYIIDRSVPFGYRRGQKLNSEDAILLKRFIE